MQPSKLPIPGIDGLSIKQLTCIIKIDWTLKHKCCTNGGTLLKLFLSRGLRMVSVKENYLQLRWQLFLNYILNLSSLRLARTFPTFYIFKKIPSDLT